MGSESSRCSDGKILRDGYTRKGYTKKNGTVVKETYVPPVCIDDLGSTENIIVKDKGDLTKHGYSTSKSVRSRRIAIGKRVRELVGEGKSEHDAGISVGRHLLAVSNLQGRTNPDVSEILHDDAMYLFDKYEN